MHLQALQMPAPRHPRCKRGRDENLEEQASGLQTVWDTLQTFKTISPFSAPYKKKSMFE
jgi:hypothetical protein